MGDVDGMNCGENGVIGGGDCMAVIGRGDPIPTPADATVAQSAKGWATNFTDVFFVDLPFGVVARDFLAFTVGGLGDEPVGKTRSRAPVSSTFCAKCFSTQPAEALRLV
jgi:hypothetical protein